MTRLVVTGTGTEMGKTVFAAGLCGMLGARYWKPIQSGLTGETDSDIVARLARLPAGAVFPERFRLREPLSPHRAAELDGVRIALDALDPPETSGALVIEGAGGAMVPLNRGAVFADLFARWQLPVILVAGTALGTISHSLSAIESLRRRAVPIHGIAFVGEENSDSQCTIADMGHVLQLGRLPLLDPLDPDTLARAFARAFDRSAFA